MAGRNIELIRCQPQRREARADTFKKRTARTILRDEERIMQDVVGFSLRGHAVFLRPLLKKRCGLIVAKSNRYCVHGLKVAWRHREIQGI